MAPKRILVVDDDPDIQFLLKKHLEYNGYRCDCVGEAETALQMLSDFKPDLVVLDLGLKEANGTAFLKHAGSWLPDGDAPPVIILSGHDQQEIIDYCMEHGARDFIRKPFELGRLMTVVHRQLVQ